jgi:hypothetical protein
MRFSLRLKSRNQAFGYRVFSCLAFYTLVYLAAAKTCGYTWPVLQHSLIPKVDQLRRTMTKKDWYDKKKAVFPSKSGHTSLPTSFL